MANGEITILSAQIGRVMVRQRPSFAFDSLYFANGEVVTTRLISREVPSRDELLIVHLRIQNRGHNRAITYSPPSTDHANLSDEHGNQLPLFRLNDENPDVPVTAARPLGNRTLGIRGQSGATL